jgi:hypothetical protein
MPAGLPVAILLVAQAAAPAYGPGPPEVPKVEPSPAATGERDCMAQNKDPNARQIVICAPKPQGYRLPPDVVEARRMKKQGETVRPKNPHETYADTSCTRVGPMGCGGAPAINLLAMAAVAAEIGARLAKGQEVGSIFETTPATGEYALYQEAKKKREEKEAEAAAAKVKAAAVAAASASTSR